MAALIPSVHGPFEVVQPLAKHTATVIFLHVGSLIFSHTIADHFANVYVESFTPTRALVILGRAGLEQSTKLKDQLPHVKWLLPNAPSRSITANQGFVMPAWFDLPSWDLQAPNQDHAGILESARTIDQHIQNEVEAGIPPGRVVLLGSARAGRCRS
jgi:hypothetical protein